MQVRWLRSFRGRILALVFAASLVPAALLLGGSLYLNGQVHRQMNREVDEALNLAINLEQTLIDGSLDRMRDRAVAVAGHPDVVAALGAGGDPQPVLDGFQKALPGADLLTVVGPDAAVIARAGSAARGEALRYGGLVDLVLSSAAPAAAAVVITPAELAGEPAHIVSKARVPVLETAGATDLRTGKDLPEALALVGAAPVRDPAGQVIGAVLVSDILNNDHAIVDEVLQRSPQEMPVHASIALDGVRVTTTVPAVGGGRRAVGTLYSDVVMERLRAGQEYRGRALVGGWQWQRTIYLPLRDPSGQVIAAPFVGIPEAAFADLAQSTATTTFLAVVFAVLSLVGPLLLAYRVTERMGHSVSQMGSLSQALRTTGDQLSAHGLEATNHVAAALAAVEEAVAAAARTGEGAQQAGGRMRDLEVALARINAGSEEQTRTLRHAGQIVALVTQAVQEARTSMEAVLEAVRAVLAAAQQGRHGVLRATSTLELTRIEVEPAEPAEGPARLDRLLTDLEQAQAAVGDCDDALAEIARRTEEATERLWALAAILNESGARSGAVSQQMTDLTQVAEETADRLRSTSGATRQIIKAVEAMADGIGSGVSLARQAEARIADVAKAAEQLQTMTEQARRLATELEATTNKSPF